MAQYLPYIPETIPEPALYKPDFNFFDRMLQRKQSMFEQGLSRVRSAYSSVLNAPLSNKNNIPLRDQYIKNAQEQLTKLSSSDLSLMENVNAAESIYAPFWQDKFIVQDAAMTKGYQAEMQKYMSWKDSAKPEEREKYNSIGMMYLQNGLSKLQNADRTPEAFGAVEMRKAEPFTNIEAYLQKQAKDQGLEVKYDDPNGPYLIETVNGQRSQQKYVTWASSMIGNNFQGQFDVTGTVENEERIKILKRSNPNITDQEAQQLIAKDVVSELNQGYTKRNQEADVEIARIDSLLGSIGQTGGPQNEQMFNKLVQERAELVAKKSAINEEYKYFDQGKDKVLEYATNAPKQYFSVLAKQRLINNWATGRASIDQKLVKENTGFTAAQNIDIRRAEHNLAVNNAAFDQFYKTEQLKISAAKGTGTGTGTTTGTGTGTGNITTNTDVPGVSESGSMVYAGKSGIDITRTEATAYDVYNKNQKQNFVEAHNLIFDQRGILGFATKLGLDQKEISQVATYLQKEIATDYVHVATKEEKAAYDKLGQALIASPAVKEAGIKSITGPGTMRNALIAYSSQYLSERSEIASDGSDIALTSDEFEALMRYSTAVSKLDSYSANDRQRQELIEKNLLTNKNYSHLLIDKNGKKDLVTISDLEKKFKATEFEDEDGNKVTLTAKDLATAYVTGNMRQYVPTGFSSSLAASQTGQAGGLTVGKTVVINGKEYSSSGTIYPNPLMPSASQKYLPKGLEELEAGTLALDQTYKSSQQLAKDIQGAQHSIVPNLLMYKNLTGRQGALFSLVYKSNKTGGDDAAATIVNQAFQVGNSEEIYDGSGAPLAADKIEAVRALLKNEKNMEEYTTAEYIPQGINGKRTVRVTLSKPLSAETKEQIGGVNLNELGTTFNVVLKDNTAGTFLDQLPNNTGFQIYDAITRGQEIKSDPILDAAGFKYTITPNTTGIDATPEYVTVDLKYKVRTNKKDPQTGQLVTGVEEKSYLSRINLMGQNAKSPDEIVQTLQQLYYNNMQQNRAVQLEYQNFINTNRANGGSVWDPKAALQAAGLSHLIK
jgi:hypothetical protein